MMEERLIALLRLAIKYNATDIHFTCKHSEVSIEMRVNGKCYRVKEKFEDYKLLRYLQYLANLDVGKILIPQTGQFDMEVDGMMLSLRFAIINSLDYTNGVLRILNNKLSISADRLSRIKKQNDYFISLLEADSGLILFSGATGSGKTTTLYTLLKTVKNKKIYTIEDPIEIYHDEFVQLAVNEALGFDYDAGIKQIMRHDPDIIMIGEIRDEKAAKAAVVAANTGHLVLSSIHTSKACTCISRMLEFGVNEQHLYENLLCLSNQKMMSDEKNNKFVIYEIMDLKEIDYYRIHQRNSERFLSISKQIGMLSK